MAERADRRTGQPEETSEAVGAGWLRLVVLAAAGLHALFYATFMPAWNTVNEPQHLDYVLRLREGRIPDIRQPVGPDVVQAVWRAEPWRTYRTGRPASREEALGRNGRSYEGYQPPFYYALMVPLAALAGGDPLRAMYSIRLASVMLLVVLAAVTWALTLRWFPAAGVRAAAGAALVLAAIPVVASSCARVTNDALTVVLVAGGVLAVCRLVERPTVGRAAVAGLLGAAALLTKSPGVLLAPVILGGLLVARRHRALPLPVLLAGLGPVAAAWTAWAAFTHMRYGVPEGTWAFLAIYGRPTDPSHPPLAFVRELWLSTWVPPPVHLLAGAPGPRIATSAVLTLIVLVGLWGCLRREPPWLGLGAAGLLLAGSLAILWTGNVQRVVPPVGRVLMVAYPVGAALVVGGWTRLLGRRAALWPAGVAWVTVLAYEAFQLVPLVKPWWFRP